LAKKVDHFPGFNHDLRREKIGQGALTWKKAKTAFRNWEQFPEKWTRIAPRAPLAEVTR